MTTVGVSYLFLWNNKTINIKITRKSRRKKRFGGCSCWKKKYRINHFKGSSKKKQEECRFISVEERYTLFEQMVKEANKIIEEKYRLLFEEIKEKHKQKVKIIN